MITIDTSPTAALLHLWQRAADRYRDRVAVSGPGCSASYADVDAAADSIAAQLREHTAAGDAVLIDLPRDPRWLPALLGIWRAATIAVPLPPTGPLRDVMAERTGATCRLSASNDDPLTGVIGIPVPERSGRWAPTLSTRHAYVMGTSGTTGEPKLAAITHKTGAAVISGLHAAVPFSSGERALHTAAFTFSSSIRQLLLPLSHGAAVTVLAPTGRFDPEHLLKVVDEEKVTSLDLTPSQLAALTHWLEHGGGRRPAHLRRLLVASEAFSPDLLARWRQATGLAHTVYHLYGQTETGGAVSALPVADPETGSNYRRTDGRIRRSSLPLAAPGGAFTAVLDGPVGAANELLIGGLDQGDGYLTPDGLDRSRYEHRQGGLDHLYRTGDRFVRAAAGTLAFVGRTDTEVKILGVRVDLLLLEQQVAARPGVTNAVAIAIANQAGGARLCVVYTATGSDLDDEVARTATAAAGPGLPPVTVHRVDSLPMTTSGKINRSAVRAAVPSVTAERPGPADSLIALWSTAVNDPTVDEHQDFFAAGGNSLSMLELLAAVHRAYNVRILPAEFHRCPTVAGLRALLPTHPLAPEQRAAANAEQQQPDNGSVRTVPSLEADRPLLASALQRQFWIGEQLDGSARPTAFWLPVDLQVPARLDIHRLEQALRQVAEANDILRAGFHRDGAELVIDANVVDPTDLVVHRGEGLPDGIIVPADRLGLMAGHGPLIHLGAAVSSEHTRISLRVHHSVADRSSVTRLLLQLADAYTNGQVALSPSYLRWHEQHQRQTTTGLEEARAYWNRVLPFPDGPAAPLGPAHIGRHALTIGRIDTAAPGASGHATWLFAYHRALASEGLPQPDLIGVDVDLRSNSDQAVIGPCVTTLPVVITATNATAPSTMADLAGMLAHRNIPIDDIVAPARRPSGDPRQPYFRHHFVHQPDPYPPLHFDANTAVYHRTPAGLATNTTTVYVRDTGSDTVIELAYDTRTLRSAAAQGLVDAIADTIASGKVSP